MEYWNMIELEIVYNRVRASGGRGKWVCGLAASGARVALGRWLCRTHPHFAHGMYLISTC